MGTSSLIITDSPWPNGSVGKHLAISSEIIQAVEGLILDRVLIFSNSSKGSVRTGFQSAESE